MRKLAAFCVSIFACIALWAMPASASTYAAGHFTAAQIGGGCPEGYWDETYGGGYGFGEDLMPTTSCGAQTISFYQLTDPANGHNTIYWTYTNYISNGYAKASIPGGSYLLFNDFNFWRADNVQIGWRIRTFYCPAGSWPPYC